MATLVQRQSRVHLARQARIRLISGLSVALVLAVLVGVQPRFVTPDNLRQVALSAAILVVVATAEAVVVLTKQIDLSVGSMLGLVAYLAADTLAKHPALPPVVVFGLALALGAVVGAVNGVIILFGQVSAFIATIATLAVYRGVLFLVSNGGAITANQIPDSWLRLVSRKALDVPIAVWIAAIVCIAGSLVFKYTRGGRAFYAIGSNLDAAKAAGVRTRLVTFAAFCLSGALCGLAGAMWSSLYGAVDSTAGTGYEMLALAAVVIGGVSTTGGRGTLWGAGLGAVFLIAVTNILALFRVDSLWAQAFYGFVILVAVSV
ncbi:MAG TPA: ABC transporter permease, partial [Polyangiaceae bacterium]|nr:ABC transporter permease [Polyangiaceae bacterium]